MPVADAPPAGLVYSMSTAAYRVGEPISANRPSVSGGAVNRYSVSPQLPAGLSIDAGSGIISGTPSAVTDRAVYTVTAQNAAGSATARLELEVGAALAPPSGLSYQEGAPTYPTGQAISANAPSSSGGPISNYSVAPALPAGLSIDRVTGIITGIPTAAASQAVYTVTGSNSAGATTVALQITVTFVPIAPTSLAYGSAKATYFVGDPAVPNLASIVGGTGATFTVSPALPAGLSINAQTGAISGTPSAQQAKRTYTVTAGNEAGSVQAQVDLEVVQHDTWAAGFPMPAATYGAQLVLLRDGRVLAAGGYTASGETSNAAIFDPDTSQWVAVAPMLFARANHQAVLLSDGRVLVAGGTTTGGSGTFRSEIFDPSTLTWQATGSLAASRYHFKAVAMPNGRVWALPGNFQSNAWVTSVESFDPATNLWTELSVVLQRARSRYAAQLLADGSGVLLVGGSNVAPVTESEFVPIDGTSPAVAAPTPVSAPIAHAVRLPGGKILVADSSGGTNTWIFDPGSSAWTTIATQHEHAGSPGSLLLLPSGKAYNSGGAVGGMPSLTADVFDPATNSWTAVANKPTGTEGLDQSSIVLADGRVLVAGGRNGSPNPYTYIYRP